MNVLSRRLAFRSCQLAISCKSNKVFVPVCNIATVNKKPPKPKYDFDPNNTTVNRPHMATTSDGREMLVNTTDFSIDEVAASIDTTLTPEQREYVEMLKKKAKGTSTVRSLYRDVPLPEELKSTGNFISKVAPNAQELIDYAYTFVPKRDGARNSRRKKRMLARIEQSHHDHQRRIKETVAAQKRVQARRLKQAKLMKQYAEMAIELNYPTPINYERRQQKKENFRLMRDRKKLQRDASSN
jgi:hypothetical protein